MITGKDCFVLVDTAEIWLKDLKEYINKESLTNESIPTFSDEIVTIWKLLKELYIMLEYNSEKVEEIKRNNFIEEWEFFENFGKKYTYIFGTSCCYDYLHIIVCHTISVS